MEQILESRMAEFGIKGRIRGRPKHIYSIYQKMERQKLDMTRIYDLIAFRIIVDSVKSCYETLALIHALWEPVEGRYKDYIARPKSNMYQSLHTTVIGPYGERMEVQIRTEEMDRIANEGIAAHWLYKEGKPVAEIDRQETQRFSWFRQIMELSKDWSDPKSVIEAVKVDFYPDEVYVFTPNGDVKAFPKGSTPVDFAYEVHTEVGHRCVGARVNGKLVPLRYELQNGDTVEVLTSANHRPSKDWLKQVKSSQGDKPHQALVQDRGKRAFDLSGQRNLRKGIQKERFEFQQLPEFAPTGRSCEGLFVEKRRRSARRHWLSQDHGQPGNRQTDRYFRPKRNTPGKRSSSRSGSRVPSKDGIKVEGLEDILIRMAQCCNPRSGRTGHGIHNQGPWDYSAPAFLQKPRKRER